MKITTWNVNGIRAREAQLLDWIDRERPDVLCLQEVKASPEDVPERLTALPDYWSYWHGHKGYSGVALFLRREAFPARPTFTHPPFDEEHRIACVQVDDLVIASIYVPNGNKDYPAKVRFLSALEAWVKAQHEQKLRLLLCGDLNVAREVRDVHPKLSKPTEIGQTPEEQAMLERILSLGLTDLLRKFDPDNDQLFTWWAPWRNLRERNIGWRLDYVLASPEVASLAERCAVFREFGTSDHGPVQAAFKSGVVRIPAIQPEEIQPPATAGQMSLDLGAKPT